MADDGEEGEGAKKSAKTKTPSKDIKIEQIRNLADFMNISTHRRGLRVVVLYPAEALNTPASNALLKTTEEPPPGTLFLLASNSSTACCRPSCRAAGNSPCRCPATSRP